MRKTTAENGSPATVHHFLKSLLFGMVAGLLITILSFVICALLMTSRDVPQSFVSVLALLSSGLGGFFAGFVSAKIAGSKGLFLGLICGGIISLVIAAAGFSVLQQLLSVTLLAKFLLILAASCLGGVLGVNGKKRRRKS